MPLRSKAAAITAAKDFLEMVRVQHNAQVVGWMSDAGGEYKSELFDRALLEKGIKIFQSAPWTPMQNGRAEQLGRTLMDKSESMRCRGCGPYECASIVSTRGRPGLAELGSASERGSV